jgi:hypothetical protein
MELDRELRPDIARMEALVRSGELTAIAREYLSDFE